MILEIGKYGIVDIRYDGTSVKKIVIHKGITDIPKIVYNTHIQIGDVYLYFSDENSADKMLDTINDILCGTREDKLKRILGEE